MNTMKQLTLVGALSIAVVAIPSALQAQRSGVEIWANACGRCHTAQPPNRYTAKDWDSIGRHMILTARLTTAQGEAVLEFLKAGALRTASAGSGDGTVLAAMVPSRQLNVRQGGPTAEEVFGKQCAACHGETGRGNGPAAVAFNPRPADFTDPETFAGRTDEDLVESITEGVRQMPPFGAQLSSEMIADLVRYIRSLNSTNAASVGSRTR